MNDLEKAKAFNNTQKKKDTPMRQKKGNTTERPERPRCAYVRTRAHRHARARAARNRRINSFFSRDQEKTRTATYWPIKQIDEVKLPFTCGVDQSIEFKRKKKHEKKGVV